MKLFTYWPWRSRQMYLIFHPINKLPFSSLPSDARMVNSFAYFCNIPNSCLWGEKINYYNLPTTDACFWKGIPPTRCQREVGFLAAEIALDLSARLAGWGSYVRFRSEQEKIHFGEGENLPHQEQLTRSLSGRWADSIRDPCYRGIHVYKTWSGWPPSYIH